MRETPTFHGISSWDMFGMLPCRSSNSSPPRSLRLFLCSQLAAPAYLPGSTPCRHLRAAHNAAAPSTQIPKSIKSTVMSGATSNLFQLWQIPSRQFFLRTSKFGIGLQSTSNPNFYPIVCSCREVQTSAYEVVTSGSFIPRPMTERESKLQDSSTARVENVGAFQKLPNVMPSIDIISSALKKAKKVPPTKGIANIAKRERNRGAKQLDALMKELAVPLRTYTSDFPDKRNLHPYERSLVELTLGEGRYEEVLRSVDGLRKKLVSVGKEHASLCAKSLTKKEAEERLNEGLRRIEDIFKNEKKALDDLLDITKTLRAMPVVNLETPTLCLVGAPNVGKSSLVRVVSTGKPEICNYPFTTRGILMGHIVYNYKRFQVTDTPGLLTRHDDDRNNLEKLTLAVLSHLPTAVLYVHDLTGECGTSPPKQFVTYKEIRERFSNHLWLDVVSKCDLLEESSTVSIPEGTDAGHSELMRYLKLGPEGAIHVSVKSSKGLNELKEKVHSLLMSQSSKIGNDNRSQAETFAVPL